MMEISLETIEQQNLRIDLALAEAVAQGHGPDMIARLKSVGVLTAESAFTLMADRPIAVIRPVVDKIAIKLATNVVVALDATGTMTPVAAIAIAADTVETFRDRMERLLGTSHGGFARG